MQLILAVGASLRTAAVSLLDGLTVGRWSRNIRFLELGANKSSNENDLHLAASESAVPIFAAADLVPTWMEKTHRHIQRFKRDDLISATVKWLEEHELTWQSNLKKNRGRGAFSWADVSQWRAQFAQVNPRIGTKVADALLAQLHVVPGSVLGTWLHEEKAHPFNAYFAGSDPHSGDYGMLPHLAGALAGPSLFEVMRLPELPAGAEVRLFADGGWSGGESARRLNCIVTSCENKQRHVSSQQGLNMRFGYLTDQAEEALHKTTNELRQKGHNGQIYWSCPKDNLLVTREAGHLVGLAFRDPLIQTYVDPTNSRAMYELCLKIGTDITNRRPLGTNEIASTIAFEHSLPKAMLPVFIFGGPRVRAHDGTFFYWKPLLNSAHVTNPARNDNKHHCKQCPLNPKIA